MASFVCRPRLAYAAIAVVAAVLAGCAIQGGGSASSNSGTGDSEGAARRGQAVKVALLLPLTSTGHTTAVAKAMKQAGELALFELDNPNFQLIVKDDKGTPEGARAAAEEALREGAELIIGPLFAQSVQAIAPMARQSGVPVLAFSNDRKVAGDGVYLLGFLPEQEVDRIVSFSASQGHRRFAALLADDVYGRIAEEAFRNAVMRVGGTLAALETYPAEANRMVEPTQRIAAALRNADDARQPIDALFVPGGPDTLPSLGPLLAYASIDVERVKVLGSGGWDFPNIGREGVFLGGWYPSADPRGWRDFSERFAKSFGSSPPRLASMAYDAVTIAIKLSSQPAHARYTAANLTRPSGFSGVDGPLRLLENGLPERSLAVMQVQNVGAKIVDQPPGLGATYSSSPLNRLN